MMAQTQPGLDLKCHQTCVNFVLSYGHKQLLYEAFNPYILITSFLSASKQKSPVLNSTVQKSSHPRFLYIVLPRSWKPGWVSGVDTWFYEHDNWRTLDVKLYEKGCT